MPTCNFRSLIKKYYGRHGWPRARPNVFAPPAIWRRQPWKGLLPHRVLLKIFTTGNKYEFG